ncbi:MAG: MFS transporter [Cellulomonadaceae bacterium]|jgi:predicted MFS family arabinose efflux permease|nr:MFS transporter [Cellulomonadaceae bacterium]
MPASNEVNYTQLSKVRQWMLLALVSAGSSIIYYVPYLRWVFPDQMATALNITNQQVGVLMSAYAITAMIFYIFAGILADKIRMRTLSWVGYISSAALLLIMATLPSFGIMVTLMIGLGVTTILIWWGTRYKLVRLLFAEDEYPSRIGFSYMFYALAGLLVGNVIAQIILHTYGEGHEAAFLRTLLIVIAIIIAAMGVAALLFIPKFDNELDPNAKALSLTEFAQALKNPAVIFAGLTMFFVYFVYTSMTYTTQWLTMGPVLAAAAVATMLANVRSYGVGIVSGPLAGTITKKVGSASKVIIAAFILIIGVLIAFIAIPWGEGSTGVAAALVLLLGFVALGQFYITSGQLTEARVPTTYFGAASGVLSLLGFAPDTFRDIWFGGWVDTYGEGAFDRIFWVMIVAAVLGIACAVVVLFIARRNRALDDVTVADDMIGSAEAELEK